MIDVITIFVFLYNYLIIRIQKLFFQNKSIIFEVLFLNKYISMQFTPIEAHIFQQKLIALGYRKHIQNFQNSDYVYWKTFNKENKNVGYKIGYAFYDLSPYTHNHDPKPVHLSYHFMLGNNSKINRLDITISDDRMSIEDFEKFCEDFYNTCLAPPLEICL